LDRPFRPEGINHGSSTPPTRGKASGFWAAGREERRAWIWSVARERVNSSTATDTYLEKVSPSPQHEAPRIRLSLHLSHVPHPNGPPPKSAPLEATASTVEHIKGSATLEEWEILGLGTGTSATTCQRDLPVNRRTSPRTRSQPIRISTATPTRKQPPRWGGKRRGGHGQQPNDNPTRSETR